MCQPKFTRLFIAMRWKACSDTGVMPQVIPDCGTKGARIPFLYAVCPCVPCTALWRLGTPTSARP